MYEDTTAGTRGTPRSSVDRLLEDEDVLRDRRRTSFDRVLGIDAGEGEGGDVTMYLGMVAGCASISGLMFGELANLSE